MILTIWFLNKKGEEKMSMKKLLQIHREIIRENAQKEQEWREAKD